MSERRQTIDPFADYTAWYRWRNHGRARPHPTDTPAGPCELCAGTGWAQVPDPFFGGALVDQRCPLCEDTTVRAKKRRWENDDGTKVGPR